MNISLLQCSIALHTSTQRDIKMKKIVGICLRRIVRFMARSMSKEGNMLITPLSEGYQLLSTALEWQSMPLDAAGVVSVNG